MASSSSSSHVTRKMYDVFISFRGSDIRHGFLSHLTKELRREQIDFYVDERLERGDEVSSALVKAIEGSVISLVIFSKDYASSKWCMEELVKIMECKETNHQIVIPVFFNIHPSDVRHQKGPYLDTFAEHEERFKDNMDILQIWRFTLTKAANLSGYHYSSNSQNESQLIDEILQDVLKNLDDTYPVEPKCLVGVDQNLACIESLSNIESDEIQSLGIWGMGGIGKTTLARAVYDKFSYKFQSCCFLENVREESKQINGLSCLLQKLLSELLDQENLHMNDAVKARFRMVRKRRLRWRKVLVVLDDVDTSEQLEYLIGEQLCLGPGSRIIVTTRDKHVLVSTGILLIHEMKALNFEESMKLFSLNAFNQCHPKKGYEKLSRRAVGYAKGIPLALKVLGSHFHSRNMETWESALKKLQKYPNMQVQNVLKVSYEGLDDAEKEILLDIAFFFQGESKDDVISVLDAFGFYATVGIDNLLNKALITVSYNNIQMHDLIEEMCKQIVREESPKHPERRSRLRDGEEICHVLKNNKGTDAIEGIMLDVSWSSRDLHLNADTFTRMTSLRYLKLYCRVYGRSCNYVNLPVSLNSFPDKLGYLHWDGYPWKSLPSISCAEKLVELTMENSQVRKLWESVQDFVNLKRLNLRGSRLLEELPDFSKAQNLEEVNLVNCESLSNLHPSILSLHTLVYLYLDGCKNLRSLQSEVHLKSLKLLHVDECYRLEEFSLSSEEITCLYLEKTGIGRFHSAIGRLCKLEVLHLNGSKLRNLAANELSCLRSLKDFRLFYYKRVIHKEKLRIIFGGLHSLEKLHLTGCTNLSELPDNISDLTSLHKLVLEGSNVENLPASIKHLPNLKKVYLRNCRRLLSIPELPPYITCLNADDCVSLEIVPPLTTFKRKEDDNEEDYSFTFQNCLKLHDHSFMVEFSHVSLKRGAYNNYDPFICYPGSTVPKWFVRGQTTETSNPIELTPSFDDLKGFFCCAVLSHLIQRVMDVPGYLECHVELEDCEYATGWSIQIDPMELNSDHVFLWYQRGEYISEAVKRRGNIHGTTCNPKISFQFSLLYESPISYERRKEITDSLLKACGVCPIYASEYDQFLQQIEFKVQTKRLGDMDCPKQLPSAKFFRTHSILNDYSRYCDGPGSFMGQVYFKKRRSKGPLTISGADESMLASDKAARWQRLCAPEAGEETDFGQGEVLTS